MPLTGFLRGYCLLTTTFAWRSLAGGTFFFFFVSKMYSLFFGTPSPDAITYVTDEKHAVV